MIKPPFVALLWILGSKNDQKWALGTQLAVIFEEKRRLVVWFLLDRGMSFFTPFCQSLAERDPHFDLFRGGLGPTGGVLDLKKGPQLLRHKFGPLNSVF